jgi:hypothetical protein
MSTNIEVSTWEIFGIPVIKKITTTRQLSKSTVPAKPQPQKPKPQLKPFKDPLTPAWSPEVNVHYLER